MRTRLDWRLRVFRLGLVGCVVLAVVAVTQFDIVSSAVAIWNRNPTAHAIAAAVSGAAERESNCLTNEAHTPQAEFPSSCYSHDLSFRGMPGDEAFANLEGFLGTLAVLFAMLFGVITLGLRMARESRVS
jgi:hypothetical protein